MIQKGWIVAWMLAGWMSVLRADQPLPPSLQGLEVTEKLGSKIDLDLEFVAENGRPVSLRRFFQNGKPVILNLVYYSCPMLCNLILNGQTAALRELDWTIGDQFQVVTISFDPNDNFDLARKKRLAYLESYGRPAEAWRFLTDYRDNARKLAAQLGFPYRWDEEIQQYAHPAVIFVLSPDGMISRYLYGVRFKERDLRLALTEAAREKFGLTVERFLLFCYHYDPDAKSYVPFAANIMRLGGGLTVFVLGTTLFVLFRRERSRAALGRNSESQVAAK